MASLVKKLKIGNDTVYPITHTDAIKVKNLLKNLTTVLDEFANISVNTHINAGDTNNVFAIKNINNDTVGSIALSTAANGAAKLTFTDGSNNTFDAVLPNLTFDSQRQMLQYVDAGNQNHDLIRLSNLQIKDVATSDLDTYITGQGYVDDNGTYVNEGETPGEPLYTYGDLILAPNGSSGYNLYVCSLSEEAPSSVQDMSDYSLQFTNLGSINNVSLVADQVAFTPNGGLSSMTVQGAIEEVRSLIDNASIKDIYPDMYPNILYVVDGNGYIGLKLDVNGFDIASISTHLTSMIQNIAGSGGEDSGGGDVTPSDGSTWLTGKRFVAIGASTSHLQTGVASWQEEFANRTGAVFYKSIQNDLAEPGARCLSFVGNDRSDQFRLKLLKEKIDNGQAENVDVIIFMNGNDNNFSNYGAISDTPFFQQQIIYSSTIYENLDAANNAFGKSAQVPGIAGGVFPNVDENNRIGTIGRLRYASSNSYVWKKLTINNNASSSGSFTLQVGDSNYLIPVTLGDTPSTIIEEILSNDSGDYVFEKVEGENAIKISISEASAVVSVTGASNLGINAVLTDYSSGGVSYKQVCFLSRNKNDWGDYTKWGTPSLFACFMGMLEYAMTNFPNTQLFVFSTPRFIDVMEGNRSSYLRADGTFDIYSWNANNKKTKDLASSVNVKRNACSLFNVPFLEVKTESNISVYNASSFYSSGGVHPLSVGYRRWGATLARLLTGK